MKRLIPVGAILALGITLGGCTFDDFIRGLTEAQAKVEEGIGAVRQAAATYCGAIVQLDDAATNVAQTAGGSCKFRTKMTQVTTGIAAACNNINNLDSDSIAPVLGAIKGALTAAKAAQAGGC